MKYIVCCISHTYRVLLVTVCVRGKDIEKKKVSLSIIRILFAISSICLINWRLPDLIYIIRLFPYASYRHTHTHTGLSTFASIRNGSREILCNWKQIRRQKKMSHHIWVAAIIATATATVAATATAISLVAKIFALLYALRMYDCVCMHHNMCMSVFMSLCAMAVQILLLSE